MKRKGFTVLFAVIVASLVLALGLGIVAITMKEVKLSGTGRDSQFAFYAADSGAECALYWDGRDMFATSSDSAKDVGITCNNLPTTATKDLSDSNSATSTFQMFMGASASDTKKPCATVSVYKHKDTGGVPKTIIDSRGYSTCDLKNQRRLERGYRISY